MKSKDGKRGDERDRKENGGSRGDVRGEGRSSGKSTSKADGQSVKQSKKSGSAKSGDAKAAERSERSTKKQSSTKAAKVSSDGKRVSTKRKVASQDGDPGAGAAKPEKAKKAKAEDSRGAATRAVADIGDEAVKDKPVRHFKEKPDTPEKAKKAEKADKAPKPEKAAATLEHIEVRTKRSAGPCAAATLDDMDVGAAGDVAGLVQAYSPSRSSSYSSGSGRRRRQRERESLRGASGFSAPLVPPPPPPPPGASEVRLPGGSAAYPAAVEGALVPLTEKVRGLLDNQQSLAQEVARMKQAMESVAKEPGGSKEEAGKTEGRETVLRMPPRLHESLLHPDNEPRLLARTGLISASLNEDGLVVLRADSRKSLAKALGHLRRVAYHCQWGCSKDKVASLLAERPTRPVHTMVVRLAATSSRLQSFELRLTNKLRKLRIGTQAGACQMVVEGIPGLSRKHCTITFEPDKGACYVQDLSTNGTYFNGKRLPRPPYKNPQDARVRVFHGDELFFRLRSEETEELGYVINLLELN